MSGIEIENEPGTFVTLSRARWMVAARQALFSTPKKLRVFPGSRPNAGLPKRLPRQRWTEFSEVDVQNVGELKWLRGWHMNGKAINRAIEPRRKNENLQ